ncbi:Eco57I restriction-modification methylase domain-containing protein [Nocardia africana]
MRGGREQPAADRRAGREPGGDGARKRHGRHYTPPRLAEFLAERMLAHVRPGSELSVLDPACGDGELLSAVALVAAQRFPDIILRLVGYDLNAEAVRGARARGAEWAGRFASSSEVCPEGKTSAELQARPRTAGVDGGCFDTASGACARPIPDRSTIEWRVGDFLCAATELADEHFDAVITNPPYVRTQQLGGTTAQMLSKQFGLSGRIDLTHPFVATIPRLLRPGGVLGLLCANRFLSTKAGANLRALLYAELTPVELYDLGDTRLFEASVLPAVTIAVRGHEQRGCRFVTAYESEREPTAGADLFEALISPADSVVEHAGRPIAVETGTLWTGAHHTAGRFGDPASRVAGSVTSSSGKLPASEKVPESGGSPAVNREARASRPADGDPAHCGTARERDTESGMKGQAPPIDRRADAIDPEHPPAGDHAHILADGVDARADVKSNGESHTGAFDPAIPWRMSRPDTDEWLGRIAAGTWRTFGEVARIRVGIKTNADRVFISDRWEDRPCCPEPELLRELLTHHDVAPWRIARARDTRVLYPYEISCSCRTPVDLGEYPDAAAYLAQYKDTLAARDYLTGTGREWFEIWVPQRPHLWCRPKVVFPDISVAPRFALDRSGAVVNGDCYWMSLADIGDERIAYLLMGVANSTLGLRFYDAVCGNRLYAGRRRWITQYVTRLPLPDPNTDAGQRLTDLARELANGAAEPDAALLDRRVAAAFGLGETGVGPSGSRQAV